MVTDAPEGWLSLKAAARVLRVSQRTPSNLSGQEGCPLQESMSSQPITAMQREGRAS